MDEREARRLKLQGELKALLGSSNVYFQPPKTITLKYPCIVYNRMPQSVLRADNKPYMIRQQYQVTYITKNPDDPIITSIIEAFEDIEPTRFFVSDNLYHNNYTLKY
jgi:hypothetical protein